MPGDDEALAMLPTPYAQALRLRRQGLDPAGIARELAVDDAAIGPLLRLAEAKLARLLEAGQWFGAELDAET
jgi:DNA-directed RNA polymerase specialized sigma24 family protein